MVLFQIKLSCIFFTFSIWITTCCFYHQLKCRIIWQLLISTKLYPSLANDMCLNFIPFMYRKNTFIIENWEFRNRLDVLLFQILGLFWFLCCLIDFSYLMSLKELSGGGVGRKGRGFVSVNASLWHFLKGKQSWRLLQVQVFVLIMNYVFFFLLFR